MIYMTFEETDIEDSGNPLSDVVLWMMILLECNLNHQAPRKKLLMMTGIYKFEMK